jgi:hypothetical protein
VTFSAVIKSVVGLICAVTFSGAFVICIVVCVGRVMMIMRISFITRSIMSLTLSRPIIAASILASFIIK